MSYMTISSQENHHFSLCSYFHAHPTTLLIKILGGPMHGPSPQPQIFFGGTVPPVPPRSLPLSVSVSSFSFFLSLSFRLSPLSISPSVCLSDSQFLPYLLHLCVYLFFHLSSFFFQFLLPSHSTSLLPPLPPPRPRSLFQSSAGVPAGPATVDRWTVLRATRTAQPEFLFTVPSMKWPIQTVSKNVFATTNCLQWNLKKQLSVLLCLRTSVFL